MIQRQAKVGGHATACVLWVALGDPQDYPCGEAYRKAMGLNLKERSSGKYKAMKITKRGRRIVRRWMYFAAMRMAQSVFVRRWFEAKKAKDKDRGNGALIAVARKLALALHAVGAQWPTLRAVAIVFAEGACAEGCASGAAGGAVA